MDIKPPSDRPNPLINRRQKRQNIGDFKNTRELKQSEIEGGRTEPGSLKNIDPFDLGSAEINQPADTLPKRHWWYWFKPSYLRRNFSPRRFVKRTVFLSGLTVLAIGLFFAFKLFFVAQNIIDRDSGGALALQGNIDPSQLKGEGDGRVNILLIGEGGDQHDNGSHLSDTIIVLSIDPFNSEAALLSLPRDMRVDIPSKWRTKINAAYALGENDGFEEGNYPKGGAGLLQKTVEQTLDIPVHYYIRVDFQGLEQAVAAVDDINLTIAETICDYHIAWQFNFSCIEAGTTSLNSQQALFYARTRNTARSDFDRGERQREVLIALKDKIFSVGTLANPIKIAELLEAAGRHVRTNLQVPGDLLRLNEIGQNIPANKILSAEIVSYLSNAGDGSTDYIPRSGDFGEIQKYVRSIFTDGLIKKEAATVDIINGSGQASLAKTQADLLRSYGYVINQVSDAPTSDYVATKLYDLSGGSAPFTRRYLEQRFNTLAVNNSLPTGLSSQAKFVIILGKDATR